MSWLETCSLSDWNQSLDYVRIQHVPTHSPTIPPVLFLYTNRKQQYADCNGFICIVCSGNCTSLYKKHSQYSHQYFSTDFNKVYLCIYVYIYIYIYIYKHKIMLDKTAHIFLLNGDQLLNTGREWHIYVLSRKQLSNHALIHTDLLNIRQIQ